MTHTRGPAWRIAGFLLVTLLAVVGSTNPRPWPPEQNTHLADLTTGEVRQVAEGYADPLRSSPDGVNIHYPVLTGTAPTMPTPGAQATIPMLPEEPQAALALKQRLSMASRLAEYALDANTRSGEAANGLALLLAREAVWATWRTDNLISQPFVLPEAERALRATVASARPYLGMVPATGPTGDVRRYLYRSRNAAEPDENTVTWEIAEDFGDGTRVVPLATGQGGALYLTAYTNTTTRLLRGAWDDARWTWQEIALE